MQFNRVIDKVGMQKCVIKLPGGKQHAAVPPNVRFAGTHLLRSVNSADRPSWCRSQALFQVAIADFWMRNDCGTLLPALTDLRVLGPADYAAWSALAILRVHAYRHNSFEVLKCVAGTLCLGSRGFVVPSGLELPILKTFEALIFGIIMICVFKS